MGKEVLKEGQDREEDKAFYLVGQGGPVEEETGKNPCPSREVNRRGKEANLQQGG